MEPLLIALLSDKSPLVLGAAISSLNDVVEDVGLIHPMFTNLCNAFQVVDEWGRIDLCLLLTRYIRSCFVKDDPEYRPVMDNMIKYCLKSRNNALVLTAARCIYLLAPQEAESMTAVVGAVVPMLASCCDEERYCILASSLTLASTHAPLFTPHQNIFRLFLNEDLELVKLKCELLVWCGTSDICLQEFGSAIQSNDSEWVKVAINALVRSCERGRIEGSMTNNRRQSGHGYFN